MRGKIIFTFDIPTNKGSLRVRIWRKLQKLGAEQEQRSYWTLPDTPKNIAEFRELRGYIRKSGGKAIILKEMGVE